MTKYQKIRLFRYIYIVLAVYAVVALLAKGNIVPLVYLISAFCVIKIDIDFQTVLARIRKEQKEEQEMFDKVQVDTEVLEKIRKSALPSNGVDD